MDSGSLSPTEMVEVEAGAAVEAENLMAEVDLLFRRGRRETGGEERVLRDLPLPLAKKRRVDEMEVAGGRSRVAAVREAAAEIALAAAIRITRLGIGIG